MRLKGLLCPHGKKISRCLVWRCFELPGGAKLTNSRAPPLGLHKSETVTNRVGKSHLAWRLIEEVCRQISGWIQWKRGSHSPIDPNSDDVHFATQLAAAPVPSKKNVSRHRVGAPVISEHVAELGDLVVHLLQTGAVGITVRKRGFETSQKG